jgi:CRP-like cAMP-binding protein
MEWTMLRGMTADERRSVLAATTRRRYARAEILFHEGDPGDTLALIAEGRVACRAATPDGDIVTFAVLGPGDVFGEMALLSQPARRTSTVRALETVTTLSLRVDQVEAFRDRYRSFDRALIDVLAERVGRLSQHLLEALYFPADKRVVRRLVDMCDQYAPSAATNGLISVPLTQTDLAELAGSTRPTVNRVLRALVDERILVLARGRIEVRDRHKLRRYAGLA